MREVLVIKENHALVCRHTVEYSRPSTFNSNPEFQDLGEFCENLIYGNNELIY